MPSVVTWYDVLGVLPDAGPYEIRDAWNARNALLQPGPLAAAPSDVQTAADRARQTVEEAWRVLADPAARESYDEQIGVVRLGGGLRPPGAGPSWSDDDPGEEMPEPYSDRPSHVVVPDVAGLFYGACMDVAGRVGLHVNPIRLTARPMPVDGLVVGQTPAPGKRAHRDSMLTVQVWHPSEPDA
jgi:hypothetical protein